MRSVGGNIPACQQAQCHAMTSFVGKLLRNLCKMAIFLQKIFAAERQLANSLLATWYLLRLN
jgi:hypothetical protein